MIIKLFFFAVAPMVGVEDEKKADDGTIPELAAGAGGGGGKIYYENLIILSIILF